MENQKFLLGIGVVLLVFLSGCTVNTDIEAIFNEDLSGYIVFSAEYELGANVNEQQLLDDLKSEFGFSTIEVLSSSKQGIKIKGQYFSGQAKHLNVYQDFYATYYDYQHFFKLPKQYDVDLIIKEITVQVPGEIINYNSGKKIYQDTVKLNPNTKEFSIRIVSMKRRISNCAFEYQIKGDNRIYVTMKFIGDSSITTRVNENDLKKAFSNSLKNIEISVQHGNTTIIKGYLREDLNLSSIQDLSNLVEDIYKISLPSKLQMPNGIYGSIPYHVPIDSLAVTSVAEMTNAYPVPDTFGTKMIWSYPENYDEIVIDTKAINWTHVFNLSLSIVVILLIGILILGYLNKQKRLNKKKPKRYCQACEKEISTGNLCYECSAEIENKKREEHLDRTELKRLLRQKYVEGHISRREYLEKKRELDKEVDEL
jgi:hypothetical protein